MIYKEEPREFSQKYLPWVLLSVLLHVVLIFVLLPRVHQAEDATDNTVEVKFVEPKEQPRDLARKQIVDIPELGRRVKPKEARYLSEHDQSVERESQAPRQKAEPWRAAIVQRSGKSTDKKKAEAVEKASRKNSQDGILPEEKKEALAGNGEAQGEDVAQAGQWPSRSETDYLHDVARGEKTYLNAEAFKQTGYYLEIKRKIEIAWNPLGAMQRVLSGGISIQRGLLSTYIGVTLNEDGTLADLTILRASGVEALDQEALRTFRVSAPFTRAPRELLSPDGKLRFEFGFIVTG